MASEVSGFARGDEGLPTTLARSHLRVVLKDVMTEAHIGLHPWEQHRERPSRLLVNVEMFAPLSTGLDQEGSGGIVDYDHVRQAIRGWPSRPHTPLLETFLNELVDLCFENARVEACRVSVMKPDIFNEVATAGVEAFVLRADHEAWTTRRTAD
jgi:dihydroneopterin aldolase